MKTIKQLLTEWDISRIIRLVLGVILLIAYISTKENVYLGLALFFGVQALLNIGCPGGACATDNPKPDTKLPIETYKPSEKKNEQ